MTCTSCKQLGGYNGMPLSYLNRNYTEPSASAGSNILQSEVGLARPVINPRGGKRVGNHKGKKNSKTRRNCKKTHKHTRKCKKGGFYPSVMGSFLQNASRLVPVAAVTGYRMVRNYNQTRRHR